MEETTRLVNVCGVPYRMTLIDGGVLFSNNAGFYGVTGRYVFEYRSHLWYLSEAASTFSTVALCHLTRMHELLALHIFTDHESAKGGAPFKLRWRVD